ncbi:MAG: glycosyltransferase family 4 protein [Clostridia bacterium]|nr:glycosyltransferase family 4 protein [Clostridia bacterium]
MKILFISGNLCDGGAQRVIAVIASELAEKGHDVSLLLFSRNEKEYPISEKVKITALGKNFEEYSKISEFSRIKKIRKYLKETKPNVAVGFLEGGYALYLSSFGLKFKKVASARINPKSILAGKGIRAKINRAWFNHADSIVLQTESQKALSPKSWLNRCTVIANPVSETALAKGKEEYVESCRSFLMIGRLAQQKNYEMALQAIQKVKETYPDIHLDIFGKGGLEETLKEQIKELGLTDNVALCGWTQDSIGEYRKHDGYLLTSDYEGMPNALMEAMAVGLPCISTNCDTGPSDLIEDGKSGFLIPVGDVDALAESILKVIKMSSEQRESIGQAARKRMQENFNNKVIAERWEELFKNLCK